ncbi:MAG: glutamate 5-kinase [Saprospiraceae bacterium]|nr:glutamate 5-kinase [Saprospiraceae bacterium]
MDKSDKKLILLKLGTGTLTKSTTSISRGKLEDIGRQILKLKDKYDFIIVSSGAIAVARQFVYLHDAGQDIEVKQALAAIGQPHLMRIIQDCFHDFKLHTAQCLLSYNDFERQTSRDNIVNTIKTLIANNYIPIINENDTVATEEIKFGDNDKLASLTARLTKTDLMILATNTSGVYKLNNHQPDETIPVLDDVQTIIEQIDDSKSDLGSGGMKSKLESARLASEAGIETWLVNGLEDNFMLKAMDGTTKFTRIPAKA